MSWLLYFSLLTATCLGSACTNAGCTAVGSLTAALVEFTCEAWSISEDGRSWKVVLPCKHHMTSAVLSVLVKPFVRKNTSSYRLEGESNKLVKACMSFLSSSNRTLTIFFFLEKNPLNPFYNILFWKENFKRKFSVSFDVKFNEYLLSFQPLTIAITW